VKEKYLLELCHSRESGKPKLLAVVLAKSPAIDDLETVKEYNES